MSVRRVAATVERHRWALLAVGYAVGVLVASLLPASGAGLGATGPLGLVAVDLWLHAVGYGALAVLAATAWSARDARAVAAVVVAVVLYGVAIEGLQGLAPTRTPSLLDATANAVGAVAGVGLRGLTSR
ncbi:VanZ family protein [Halomicrobium katesii]|uniref:VanZ family protein n=1 Tax=Halomicrobium katesii TaxID=437163 RepID=UPI00037BBB69|nr:VanZ family protein [Halomicrobium katesii]